MSSPDPNAQDPETADPNEITQDQELEVKLDMPADMTPREYWMKFGECPECRPGLPNKDTMVAAGGGYKCETCGWRNGEDKD